MAPEDIRRAFGLAMQTLRLRCGYSIEEVAAKTGISSKHLRKLEKGEIEPKPTTILKKCEVFGVSYVTFAREVERFLVRDLHTDGDGHVIQSICSGFCDISLLPDGILWAMLTGTINAARATSTMTEIYAEAQKRGASKALINFLGCDLDLSTQERLNVGSETSDWLEQHNFRPKIAAVILAAGVTGRVMRGRGFDVKTFPNEPDALKWLREEDETEKPAAASS
jgi:transcriptional regulator with XRE-family HTH domain